MLKGSKHSTKSKKKISEGHLGHKHSKETLQKMSEAAKGPNNSAWIGGRTVEKSGYIVIWTPEYRRIREHVYVYLKHHNLKKIPKGYEIHHINGIKDDNRIENLVLITRMAHNKIHPNAKRREK